MAEPVNQTQPLAVDGARARLALWLRVDAARLLWPERCLVCEAPGADGLDLCAACAAALPWSRSACGQCALPLPASTRIEAFGQTCGACLQAKAAATRRGRAPPLAAVHAACVYAAPLDRLLPRFKFHHDLAAGRLLAQLMAEAFAPLPRPGALLPVPLHRARLRQRGYDQALELARPLARALDLPLLHGALWRPRATQPQSRLDAAQRRRNLQGAFALSDGAPLPAHVALVDDVMTTGATLRAAALALRRAGVQRVDAWVCARVA
ncbi:double zinc ribbon domain-containing protein [Lysobacter koreensis]|uniref:Double zinc ribbon domain-containing protein n=1 Tax=Lysobacter koreensis TaxID=266122 RepID=A0ABW2YMK0_9GAMM